MWVNYSSVIVSFVVKPHKIQLQKLFLESLWRHSQLRLDCVR